MHSAQQVAPVGHGASADCVAHGKACGRPSVESFNAAEAARFEAFCLALLQRLSAPEAPAELSARHERMGLD